MLQEQGYTRQDVDSQGGTNRSRRSLTARTSLENSSSMTCFFLRSSQTKTAATVKNSGQGRGTDPCCGGSEGPVQSRRVPGSCIGRASRRVRCMGCQSLRHRMQMQGLQARVPRALTLLLLLLQGITVEDQESGLDSTGEAALILIEADVEQITGSVVYVHREAESRVAIAPATAAADVRRMTPRERKHASATLRLIFPASLADSAHSLLPVPCSLRSACTATCRDGLTRAR